MVIDWLTIFSYLELNASEISHPDHLVDCCGQVRGGVGKGEGDGKEKEEKEFG